MAIRKAHKVHHKHLSKEKGECFGMLFVPRKYWTEAKRSMELKRNRQKPAQS
jgi:beta-carotene 3-hydroxylase